MALHTPLSAHRIYGLSRLMKAQIQHKTTKVCNDNFISWFIEWMQRIKFFSGHFQIR
jgi:hypothetical protein